MKRKKNINKNQCKKTSLEALKIPNIINGKTWKATSKEYVRLHK
jgi:hypothetical protein